jgi:PST family polysaccharide transporter
MTATTSKPSLGKQFIKNSFWSLLQNGGNEVTSFLVFLVLARLLTPAIFGLVALAGVYLMVMQVFIDQGLHTAIIQRLELEEAHLSTAFWMNLGMALAWVLLSLVAARQIAELFGNPELAPIVQVLSVNFMLAALCMVPLALLKRQLRYKEVAVSNVVSNVFGGILGILMAYRGWGCWSLVGQQIFGYVILTGLLWSLGGWRPRFFFSGRHFRDLFSFGIHIGGVGLLGVASSRSDQYLIGRFLGTEVLGIYAVASRVLTLLYRILVGSFGDVSNSVFSKLQNEPARLAAAYGRCLRFLCVLAFPGYLFFMLMAGDIFFVFFGAKWQACVPLVRVLTLTGLLATASGVNPSIMRAVGRPDILLVWQLIALVLNIVIFFVALPYGVLGVVYGLTARAYVMAPFEFLIIRRLLPIRLRELLLDNTPTLLASLLMGGLVWLPLHFHWMIGQPWLRLPCGMLLAGMLYAFFLRILAPSMFGEVWETLGRLRGRSGTDDAGT